MLGISEVFAFWCVGSFLGAQSYTIFQRIMANQFEGILVLIFENDYHVIIATSFYHCKHFGLALEEMVKLNTC